MTGMEGSPGAATDGSGNPVLDPTANVLDLVAAAVRRLDDLRVTSEKHQTEMLTIVATHEAEVGKLRSEYQREIRESESARLDAIRAVDVSAVQQAATAAEIRATALANQVAASAEAMRAQVANAQVAAATSLAAALVPIQEAIADLRRSQYEAIGQKVQVTDTRAERAGTGMWVGIGVAIAGVLLSFTIALATIGLALYLRHSHSPTPATTTVTVPNK